jgi:hypothetical protein
MFTMGTTAPVDAYTGSAGQRQSNPLAHSASQYQEPMRAPIPSAVKTVRI